MEGIDISGIIVAGQLVDSLAHFIGRFIGKCDTENIPRQDADIVDQISETVGKRTGFPGAGACDDTHEAFLWT